PSSTHRAADNGAAAIVRKVYRIDSRAPLEFARVRLACREVVQRFVNENRFERAFATLERNSARTRRRDARVARQSDSQSPPLVLTCPMAASSALALLSVSSHSVSGTESATIPAPA